MASHPVIVTSDPVPDVSPATVRAMIETFAAKHEPRPVALRAKPVEGWTSTSKDGVPVTVVPCPSALAARETLRAHVPGEWTVLLTDREPDDLGTGVLARLLNMRVHPVQAWETVQQMFRATRSTPSLTAMKDGREIALGLIRALPRGGWPAAPGGVLTREHSLDSVLAHRLHIEADDRDMLGLIRWSRRADAADALATLRAEAGPALAAACLDRLAEAAGAARDAVRPLLEGDRPEDLAPLGLVVDVLTSADLGPAERQDAAVCLARGERWWQGRVRSSDPAVRTFGDLAARAVAPLLADPSHEDARALVDRADALLAEVDGLHLARHSNVLPSGRRLRVESLGAALTDPSPGGMPRIEAAWAALAAHRLAGRHEGEHRALHAAVRLARWLVSTGAEQPRDSDPSGALAALVRAQLDDAAWADAAINTAAVGVGNEIPARGIEQVVTRALARREEQARAFAQVLARATSADVGATDGVTGAEADGVVLIEGVLDRVITPLVRASEPVLLVVLDGLSSAAGTAVAADALLRGWEEIGLVDGRRLASVAVLPSLTAVSRTSLLSGSLARGSRTEEAAAFVRYVDQRLKQRGVLFHKSVVDSTRSGHALSTEIAEAIDDVDRTAVVSVVLNTIDDSLDRSDPGGTMWTADDVKHLGPVLDRALSAGRTVVVTGDHGHIVERRHGHQLHRDLAESARHRRVGGEVNTAEEIVVEGRRVMTENHQAVLAVSESLRYGPLKAGYHGGAHPAEVVVPVIVLRPATAVDGLGQPLPPQEPLWWVEPIADAATQPDPPAAPRARRGRRRDKAPQEPGPSLFELAPAGRPSLGATVVASDVYAEQVAMNPRLVAERGGVARLIDAFAGTGGRLSNVAAAKALGVPLARLRGAQEHAKQLLNIDGYAVLTIDADGSTLVMDEDLLCEQFGVNRGR